MFWSPWGLLLHLRTGQHTLTPPHHPLLQFYREEADCQVRRSWSAVPANIPAPWGLLLHVPANTPPHRPCWHRRPPRAAQVYARGRVALLGDAAHLGTPFLGQGCSQAIEDALELGRALGASQHGL